MAMTSLMAVRAVRSALNNAATIGNVSQYATKSGVTKQKKSTGNPGGKSTPNSSPPSSSSSLADKNVDPPAKIFKKAETSQIGPGADKNKEYKNPEYFLYHNLSYCDMDEVMAKFRLPQPSSLKK